MGIIELLMTAVGAPLAKILLKSYLGDTTSDLSAGLIDIAKKKIKDYSDQREAQRQFDRLGEEIVQRVLPLFEQAETNPKINPTAVGLELGETLSGNISAEFFVSRDLDVAKISAALRAARPLRQELFNSQERALYERALDETVRYVYEMASSLPRFEEQLARQSLKRLARMEERLDRALVALQRIEHGVGTEDGARYEADYRQAVVRNLDYVELFGADVPQESRRQALSIAYVSVSVSLETNDETQYLAAESLLDTLQPNAGRLLIRGEAGSGKSTARRRSSSVPTHRCD